MFFVLGSVVVLLDQFFKHLVLAKFSLGERLGNDWLNLAYYRNEGIAFSLPFRGIWLHLTIFLVLGLLFWYYHEKLSEVKIVLSLALITGGALSNLGDRLSLGFVVDYIGIFFWPFFNLADLSIALGALFLVYLEWGQRGQKFKKRIKA